LDVVGFAVPFIVGICLSSDGFSYCHDRGMRRRLVVFHLRPRWVAQAHLQVTSNGPKMISSKEFSFPLNRNLVRTKSSTFSSGTRPMTKYFSVGPGKFLRTYQLPRTHPGTAMNAKKYRENH
jgi:hypothetical protein